MLQRQGLASLAGRCCGRSRCRAGSFAPGLQARSGGAGSTRRSAARPVAPSNRAGKGVAHRVPRSSRSLRRCAYRLVAHDGLHDEQRAATVLTNEDRQRDVRSLGVTRCRLWLGCANNSRASARLANGIRKASLVTD